MTAVNVSDIQRDLMGYLRRVASGESMLIVADDQPVAELRPVPKAGEELRPYALCRGEFTVPADFDEPLPEDLLRAFEGR